MPKTVVGLFRDPVDAEAVLHDLELIGFSRDEVSLVAHDGSGKYSQTAAKEGSEGGAGVGTGAAIGGAAGVMLGLAALAIPGIGPVLAAGPLAVALTGAGVGAATGGMLGALGDLGLSHDHAQTYAEGLRRGGTLVVIRANEDDRAERAESILDRHGAVNIEQHVEEWRKTGWSGVDPHDQPYTMGDEGSPSEWGRTELSSGGETTAEKEGAAHDYVRDRSIVPDPADPHFYEHYRQHYAGKGTWKYEDYSDAYRYGQTLAAEPRYQNSDWDSVESEFRSRWERDNPDTWDRVKGAARHAWDHFRGQR